MRQCYDCGDRRVYVKQEMDYDCPEVDYDTFEEAYNDAVESIKDWRKIMGNKNCLNFINEHEITTYEILPGNFRKRVKNDIVRIVDILEPIPKCYECAKDIRMPIGGCAIADKIRKETKQHE